MLPPPLRRALGASLTTSEGDEVSLEEAFVSPGHQFLGLFFSADWEPNNRIILNQLTRFCQSECKPSLNIVLVSADEQHEGLERHVENTSLLAVPFSAVRRRLRLLRQYRVTNLPFLVLLDIKTGETISRINSTTLLNDPDCKSFPWKSKSVKEVLKKADLVGSSGDTISLEGKEKGILGLYFSANWCPPCRAFTPELLKFYDMVKKKFPKFEIIFVSSDRSEDSFKSYHSTMPWPAVRWDCEVRVELAEVMEVKGIPTLVILDADFSVITREGRYLVSEEGTVESFPWRPQSVELLQKHHLPFIMKSPAVVLFTDGEVEELEFGKDVLQPTAEKWYIENEIEETGTSLRFYVAGEDEASDEVRALANLDDVIPLLAIIDLSEGSKYLLEEGVELSNSSVHNFVSRYTYQELNPTSIDDLEEYPLVNQGIIDIKDDLNQTKLDYSEPVQDIFEETL